MFLYTSHSILHEISILSGMGVHILTIYTMEAIGLGDATRVLVQNSLEAPENTNIWGIFMVFSNLHHVQCSARIIILSVYAPIIPGANSITYSCTDG